MSAGSHSTYMWTHHERKPLSWHVFQEWGNQHQAVIWLLLPLVHFKVQESNFGHLSKEKLACINNVRVLMTINNTFLNSQNFKPKVVRPLVSCFNTDFSWETRFKSEIKEKAVLQKSVDVRFGWPLTVAFCHTYLVAFFFSSSFCQRTTHR